MYSTSTQVEKKTQGIATELGRMKENSGSFCIEETKERGTREASLCVCVSMKHRLKRDRVVPVTDRSKWVSHSEQNIYFFFLLFGKFYNELLR